MNILYEVNISHLQLDIKKNFGKHETWEEMRDFDVFLICWQQKSRK